MIMAVKNDLASETGEHLVKITRNGVRNDWNKVAARRVQTVMDKWSERAFKFPADEIGPLRNFLASASWQLREGPLVVARLFRPHPSRTWFRQPFDEKFLVISHELIEPGNFSHRFQALRWIRPDVQYIPGVECGIITLTGMLFLQLEGFAYIIVIAAEEQGMTGLREATITSHLLSEGKLTLETYKSGWFRDPYDPDYKRRTLRSLSDDEAYDSGFPEHPLSKVRRTLGYLQSNIRLEL